MNIVIRRSAVSAACAVLCAAIWADSVGAQTVANTATQLPSVTVTANPLGSADAMAPVAALSGDELTLRAKSTLGETLDGTPGVSSTYFGPNASRPIIRGLDGDRIRVLQNSGASLDASALSFDHAVPTDPLTVQRIEVLRGPGALLYGGSAVGGVVNVIDNRIAREALFDRSGGISGKADLGFATGNREKAAAMLVETGNQQYNLHADAFARKTADVKVPTLLDCSKPGSPEQARRICNSASDSHGGAVGGSVFFNQGYVGASLSQYRSDYGTVAEDEVTIGMKSTRFALEGEWRRLSGPFTQVKAQLNHSDYQHTEFEGSETGTVFKNKGTDFRAEARHAKLGPLEGVLGIQAESSRFSADGAEAFAPFSHSQQLALFAYEELPTTWGKLSFGVRTEHVNVESLGNPDPAVTRFAPGKRHFNAHSAALGALVRLAPAWQLTANSAWTQRAPKDYELYANGPHLATAAWETGDADLRKEQSTSVDVGLNWKQGPNHLRANVYLSRFANFIGLDATGHTRGIDGELDPLDADGDGVADGSGEGIVADTRYSGVRAQFVGMEVSGQQRLLQGGQTLDLAWRADTVRATNQSTGQPLPRIAPMRLGASLLWASGPWRARLGFDHSAAQNRVPSLGQRATDAYTLWNAALSYQTAGQAKLLWYARFDNISNTTAYSASSVLTTTAFPKAPLPGRSVKLGVQASL